MTQNFTFKFIAIGFSPLTGVLDASGQTGKSEIRV